MTTPTVELLVLVDWLREHGHNKYADKCLEVHECNFPFISDRMAKMIPLEFETSRKVIEEIRKTWKALDSLAESDGWLPREDRRAFEDELHREICESHILYGKKVTALAQEGSGDDILYFVHSWPPQYALVHLTFTRNPPESDPRWPSTEVYSSLDEFRTTSFEI